MLNDSAGFALAATSFGVGTWCLLDLGVTAAIFVLHPYTHIGQVDLKSKVPHKIQTRTAFGCGFW